MRGNSRRVLLLALAAALGVAGWTDAGGHRCGQCGRTASCRKVCKLVPDERTVETVCWGCQCEDFCVPGPSKPGCKHCDVVCDSCADDAEPKAPAKADPKADAKAGAAADAKAEPQPTYAAPRNAVWFGWVPGGAKVHTKKKLMKKTVKTKVPGFKWVVEELCGGCEATCVSAAVPPGADVPPAPTGAVRAKDAGPTPTPLAKP